MSTAVAGNLFPLLGRVLGRYRADMAQINRLSSRSVDTKTEPGFYPDGQGLYLRIGKGKRWVYLFQWRGKRREMGLGPAAGSNLAQARREALKAREMVREGVDPIEARRAEKSLGTTFGEVADDFIAAQREGWRNAKHRQQWTNTLATYAAKLRPLPVADITTADVLSVLRPIWMGKPETASRVRGRIERILDAAKAKGLRSGENPAIWRGNLAHLLPKRRKLTRGHHRALSYERMLAFWSDLSGRSGIAARALQFTILTAARTSETLGAKWEEIDLEKGVWTVPAERMKAAKEHRVPLSAPALAILKEVRSLGSAYVFPSVDGGQLSRAAMHAVLRRMAVDATVHGFRSTFRDWAGEETTHPRELVEHALAHLVGSAVERAYRRGDALERRRAVMESWAGFICPM